MLKVYGGGGCAGSHNILAIGRGGCTESHVNSASVLAIANTDMFSIKIMDTKNANKYLFMNNNLLPIACFEFLLFVMSDTMLFQYYSYF